MQIRTQSRLDSVRDSVPGESLPPVIRFNVEIVGNLAATQAHAELKVAWGIPAIDGAYCFGGAIFDLEQCASGGWLLICMLHAPYPGNPIAPVTKVS